MSLWEPALAFLDLAALLSLICNARLIIELAICLGKQFQAA